MPLEGDDRPMSDSDWHIPKNLQPDPADYAFDLKSALRSIVSLRCLVPQDAFTANTLGAEREGSGVVIDQSGLIVTISYLVTEAETIWIQTGDGRAIPGHALAHDQATGFGLVQALGRLELPALEIGNSDALEVGDRCVAAASGGRQYAIEVRLVARQEFAGYWEYALDDAFYTAPAHPFWGGTGMIGKDGTLLGIGSLVIQQGGEERERRRDMNMVVPIGLLPPILPDLLSTGRANRPPRPWLGLFAIEYGDDVVVAGLSERGPAIKAGVETGDRIETVAGRTVEDLIDLWRKIWALGKAGVEVPLRVRRDGRLVEITIQSGDRTSYLRSPQLH